MSLNTTKLIIFSFFPLFLSACVAQNVQDFDKLQAAKARVELGLGYLAQQNSTQAKLNLDRALKYAPDYYLVHSAMAYFYQMQGEQGLAEKSYLTAIKLDKNQGDVLNNYGAFLCSQGKFTQAYSQFEAALAMPNYYQQADTHENFILCALSEKNKELTQKHLFQLEKLSPERAVKFK